MNHIDHQTLKEAAANLKTIADAGYADQLRREFTERMAGDSIARSTWTDPLRDLEQHERAKLLALLTDSPFSQCRAALCGDSARRDLGLRLLSEMAGQVRQLQAQAHRQYRSPRRAG